MIKISPKLYRFTGGTKEQILMLPYLCNNQFTIGGRNTGVVKISVRPFLPEELNDYDAISKQYVDTTLFERRVNFDIDLSSDIRSFTSDLFHLSAIEVDDTDNTGEFWVSVWQFTQEK